MLSKGQGATMNGDEIEKGAMSDGNKKKRGMKSRSQRNRKRPRSELYSNDNLTIETEICRIELDGRPVNISNPWIRVVKPYPYTFATYAKARWLGRTVLDVYHSEFGSYPKLYYENAIIQGRILVSDQMVDLNYKIKGRDVLTHTVHRHEPAVAVSSEDGIDVLEETDDLVVVDKPGTLPVHACGGYHMNSLSQILEPRYGKLFNINRLDRLTSGLVLLAKSSKVAQQLGKCLKERDSCQKIYLARVKGKFPLNCPLELNEKVGHDLQLPCRHGEWILKDSEVSKTASKLGKEKIAPKTMEEMKKMNAVGAWITDTNGRVQQTVSLQQVYETQNSIDSLLDELRRCSDESEAKPLYGTEPRSKILWFHLACPTRVAKPKDGICEAGSFGDLESITYEKTVKPSETAFSVVHYDAQSDSTVLICQPMTGRTHQVRLHLQFLGHPIANDPNYGGEMWYGDLQGKEAFRRAKTQLSVLNNANTELVGKTIGTTNGDELPATSSDTPATQAELIALAHVTRSDDEPLHDFIQRSCVWCARSRGERDGSLRTTLEFLCRSRGIFLHALAYYMIDEDGCRFQYRTSETPSWALTADSK